MSDFYKNYVRAAEEASQNEELFNGFKQNPEYTIVLEHLHFDQGKQYLDHAKDLLHLSDEEIQAFCRENDKYGSPTLFDYFPTGSCSANSLRYIFQSHIILHYIKSLNLHTVSIVEIGCGYGGLLLALSFYASKYGIQIQKYQCIDIDGILSLQKKYLSKHTVHFPVTFHDAMSFGQDIQENNLFLISNYCFSEIPYAFQFSYLQHLFPKCSHGFIAWNMIDLYDIGKPISVSDEFPNTGPKNKFVYF
jgi:hypothetical protein